MHILIVINNPQEIDFKIENVEIISAKTYLTESRFSAMKKVMIFNLCKSYKYQTLGYYVSLLAEARGHRVAPNITTIQDFKSRAITRLLSEEIDQLIQKNLAHITSKEFTLSIYFGKNMAKTYDRLCKSLFNIFYAPLLRAEFVYNKKWQLQEIKPIPVSEIPESHKGYVAEFAKAYFEKRQFSPKKRATSLYDLAILTNPEDLTSPSDERAIQKFVKAASQLGFYVELITKEDFNHLLEFDALFIRETTQVNHHTYRFARHAAADGLVVIDDPVSILKCTNKVYLSELLTKAGIPIPKTVIAHRENMEKIPDLIDFPMILKEPDSSSSQGVIKVETPVTLHGELDRMLDKSGLIIVQEYLPTAFDWRIGIINNEPLFACKYYMASGHWQILNWTASSELREGVAESITLDHVPKNVIETALKAAHLIGSGLYGVDIKLVNNTAMVIEINDNPNIDAGVEDAILKDELYLKIMRVFFERLEKSKKPNGNTLPSASL